MEPLISIIIPVYNVDFYLTRCLKSVINQTYKNLEIIIVDDESEDDSLSICNEFKNKDSRIKVISIKHGGLSKARNTGLDIAKGDYIGFVDSDDCIDKDMFKKLYETLVNNGADISVCNFYRFYENGFLEHDFKATEDLIVLDRNDAIAYLLDDKILRNYVWTKLYSRHLFDGLRFPEGKTYEDIFIALKIFEKINKLAYINDGLYYYYIRSGSIVSSKKEENIKDGLEETYRRYKYVKETYYPKYKEYNITSMIERIVYCAYEISEESNLLKDHSFILKELDEDISTSSKDIISRSCRPHFFDYYCKLSASIEKN
jgi:glycosyltransferase involved in cell wall biosynthesis